MKIVKEEEQYEDADNTFTTIKDQTKNEEHGREELGEIAKDE